MEQIKRPKPAVYVFNKQGSALPNALHPQKTATFYKILYLFTEYKSNAISSANFHIFCAKKKPQVFASCGFAYHLLLNALTGFLFSFVCAHPFPER